MKSCYFNWKIYIGVFLFVTVISSLVVVEGRPQQQQYRRPYNTFNITLLPYPAPQYQHQQYNQHYQQQPFQFQHNNRASRNISNVSNGGNNPILPNPSNQHQHYQHQPQQGSVAVNSYFQPQLDPTVHSHYQPRYDSVASSNYQPQLDTTVESRYQPQQDSTINKHYQPEQKQNPVVFNNNGFNEQKQAETFHREANDMVNDTKIALDKREENLQKDARNSTITHLPASGPIPTAKEKTRILTHHVNPSRASLAEDLRGSTQDIIFPDSFENLFDPITRLDTMPVCARGGLYCEDIPTYPYHQIRDTLRRVNVNADLFFDDEIDSPKEIANRISGPEEKFICKSSERTIYPKVGMTKNNKWKYIINQNQEGYIQGVRVETCLYADRPCDLSEHMPLGIVTSCKQKYVTRRMMSLADDGVPLPDIFLMPSACCCSYRMENPLLRARNVDTTPAAV